MKTSLEPEVVLEIGQPIQQQVQDQIRSCIRSGLLRPGEPLPTVRALAVGLAINPELVNKAYVRLIQEGWVMEEGAGTFVVAAVLQTIEPRPTPLDRLCSEFLLQAACLGHPAASALRGLESFIQRRSAS